MVRFLHTADLQLGMNAQRFGQVGRRIREARMKVLDVIVDTAEQEDVDFIIVAGDMFEDNQVSERTVQRAVQYLQKTDIPVYILPGNHDYLDMGSVYWRSAFNEKVSKNVQVLREPAQIEVSDHCTLYPCPVTQRWSPTNPTTWIPERQTDDRIRVGIAHGDIDTIAEPEFPIPVDTALQKELDYLALGHWHSMQVYEDNRAAYSGSPEQTSFDEANAGNVLIVSIETAGETPSIESCQVGQLRWKSWEREVNSPAEESLGEIREDVEAIDNSESTLLRIRLRGLLRADELPKVEEFATWLEARRDNELLLYVELDSQIHTTEKLRGALMETAQSDVIVGRTVADLHRMAEQRKDIQLADVATNARSWDELIQTWTETEPQIVGDSGELEMSSVAREALKLLAQLSVEVQGDDSA